MTEKPSDQEGFGPPDEEGIDPAKVEEQLESDPDTVPNAPNRDPERRSRSAPSDPENRPGPLEPGDKDPDLASGVESFERPGSDGNWRATDDKQES